MSSVSVLPPHPSSMSAARKLALALAESAQKASSDSQGKSNLQRTDVPYVQERPPRPSVLDFEVCSQENRNPRGSCDSQWQTSEHDPMESQCCPHPCHFLPTNHGSELSHDTDGQESLCNFTPNVSPLGSGSLYEGSAERSDRRDDKELGDDIRADPSCQSIGVSTPTQPVCSTQSPSASPVYVNTESINVFNFRAVLAETSVPASVEEVLPHPLQPSSTYHYCPEEERPLGLVEDVYKNHYHHNRPLQTGRMPTPHSSRPDALPHHLWGLKSTYGQSSENRYSTLGLRHPSSPQYRCYHRDEHLISGYQRPQEPWQRTEDGIFGHPAIRRARSFHAPHVSRYALAEKKSLPSDSMFYIEQTSQEVPHQRLIQTTIHPVQPQVESTHVNYRYGPYSRINLVDDARYYNVEHCQQSGVRHIPAYTVRSTSEQSDYYNCSPHRVPTVNREFFREIRDRVLYGPRDSEGFERAAYQPTRQENKLRCKNTGMTVSPTQSPVSPTDTRSRDVLHTRSKSDPGNACILSTNRIESQNAVVATNPTSLRCLQTDPDVTRQQYGQRSSAEPSRQIQIKHQPPLRKVPSLPERGCPNLRSVEHSNRSHTRSHDQDRLMIGSAAGNYSAAAKPGILRRPGRSQSTRENRHHYHQRAKSPLDPEHLGSTHLNRRTQSTKVRPTHYDHMEAYYVAPKLKPTRSSKAVGGYSPGQGCMSPRGQRLLSDALGREAFYHAALRSDAGVYD